MSHEAAEHAAVRWRRVITYYVLLWAVSYGLVGGFLAAGGSFSDPSWVLFAQASSLAPGLLAIVLTRLVWRQPLGAGIGLRLRRDRWLLAAWLLPWVLVLGALGLGLAVPGVRWDGSLQGAVEAKLASPEQLETLRGLAAQAGLPPILLLVPLGILLSITTSFVAGCGEELGFRGLVHTQLRPLGFWRNALLTGTLWLAWHLPLIALGYGYPDHPGLGVALLSGHCLVSSVGLAYLRERAGSSLATGLFHGTTEAAALIAVAPLAGGSELTVGIGSLTWIGADAAVVCLLLAHDRFLAAQPIAWPRRAAGR